MLDELLRGQWNGLSYLCYEYRAVSMLHELLSEQWDGTRLRPNHWPQCIRSIAVLQCAHLHRVALHRDMLFLVAGYYIAISLQCVRSLVVPLAVSRALLALCTPAVVRARSHLG